MTQQARRPRGPLQPTLDRHDSIKLIGLGGVGSLVARSASRFVASLDQDVRLVLIDGDAFEPANATRMAFHRHGNKAAVVREELLPFFDETRLTLAAIEEYVTPANVDRLILDGDLVLLAVDNHATRKRVADHCAGLDEVCLISGGNDGVGRDSTGRENGGTYGNCQVYVRRGGRDRTPPLTRYHPEIADPQDSAPDEQDCVAAAASTPQLLFANHTAASTMLNALLLYLSDRLHYGELAFDIADGLMRPVPLPVASP